ncbi:MAG: hypothetical protein PF440_10640 [Thiomicrorhabdus sp.]|jgi:hypothetical protein|nr:hypothetical protein [Thiomicrorhabdus sp.]
MISLIDFEKELIIPKAEAALLGIQYEEEILVGFRDNVLQKMESYDVYKEDCIEDNEKYYKDQAHLDDSKEVSSYYLHTKYTGNIDYVFVKKENHLVSLLEFAPKCKHKFLVRESVISQEASIDNIELSIDWKKLLDGLVDKIKDNTFNKKTNVHVGGGLITTYNDLLLKEDICTDILQQELNNGWRIIAVCVQADQRRPDYILGRYNPTLEVVDKSNAGR